MMYFPDFSSEAKVWIYQADRAIAPNLMEEMKTKLAQFVDEWSAHGTKLKASGAFLDAYRLVLCADRDVEASGCSIDTSVRFIKELGNTYQINFFNRLQILVEKNGEKTLIPFSELPNHANAMIYQPAPENLGYLRNKEKLTVSEYLQI